MQGVGTTYGLLDPQIDMLSSAWAWRMKTPLLYITCLNIKSKKFYNKATFPLWFFLVKEDMKNLLTSACCITFIKANHLLRY